MAVCYSVHGARLAQGKQKLRATCPKVKLEFKFFMSPVIATCIDISKYFII